MASKEKLKACWEDWGLEKRALNQNHSGNSLQPNISNQTECISIWLQGSMTHHPPWWEEMERSAEMPQRVCCDEAVCWRGGGCKGERIQTFKQYFSSEMLAFLDWEVKHSGFVFLRFMWAGFIIITRHRSEENLITEWNGTPLASHREKHSSWGPCLHSNHKKYTLKKCNNNKTKKIQHTSVWILEHYEITLHLKKKETKNCQKTNGSTNKEKHTIIVVIIISSNA